MSRTLFLFAYTCSGFAGLVYEVGWTRLLTLYIGHSTAAASAVVAAFLGGLAAGAAVGGAVAPRITTRQAVFAYVAMELAVAVAALLLPFELGAMTPILRWAYDDGASGLLFPTIRIVACLVMVFVPAAALGATFPIAIRWFAADSDNPARSSSALYAVNTTGAAAGALLAGFVFIPVLGIAATMAIGIAASGLAAAAALAVPRFQGSKFRRSNPRRSNPRTSSARTSNFATSEPGNLGPPLLALFLSGFAALAHEIAWTRVLTLVLGPTIYAFAATLAAVILGVALGSALGTLIVARTHRPAVWLSAALAAGAVTTTLTSWLAGGAIPRMVARQIARSPNLDELLQQGLILTGALIVPTALLVGSAFPLALAIVREPSRFGVVYAVNTIGAVLGSLIAGFVLIPWLGLQGTLVAVSGCLIAAAVAVAAWGIVSKRARVSSMLAAAAAGVIVLVSPPWDRHLLASGVYLYAPYVPQDLDLETLLKAGRLLYYREGAAATVSVKRLTGTTTLAVDGKTDASNRGDMLTQKLVAHLPLLLHEEPRDVAVIGLGSGVTVGAALSHPIESLDVIEISPEVVEASGHFVAENHHALDDPRTHLIVGDGRTHLLLSQRQYDVIVSEPSNPWIAGVAALFTLEFFQAARDRLAPGGIICQWANAYNISDSDLRAIVATFTTVFPNGTAWLVGEDDVLLVASNSALDARLPNIERHWTRGRVAADLQEVSALEPFAVWSLYVAGAKELVAYSQSAAIFTDDRMTLEFSSPRELHNRSAGENGAKLAALLDQRSGPEAIRQSKARAGAAQWRNRGLMMTKRDAHSIAYDDYVRALTMNPHDTAALEGLVRTAMLISRAADALSWLKTLTANRASTPEVQVALSRLLAAVNASADAIEAARRGTEIAPSSLAPLEQLASLHADAGDVVQLDVTVARMQQMAPDHAATHYYTAVSAFLKGALEQAILVAQRSIAADAQFAPVYDLIGAAYTKLGRVNEARAAFETSLRFDAHDSTAYTNLGLIELASGNGAAARNYFAEALWLVPDSAIAREGLAQTK